MSSADTPRFSTDAAAPLLPPWAPSPALTAVLLAVIVLLALFAAWMFRQQRRQPPGANRWRGTTAVQVAAVAAVGCTAYSADTSWRFAGDYLAMTSSVERAFMFAIAELALFATALMARQNLNGPARAPGLPGVLVWMITAVQLIPPYAEFGPVGGTVRALIGPVMAAMLWHLAMGIELRHRTPDAASRSFAAILARQAREHLLARLSIADQDADAARIIRERALSDAVTLILRAEAIPDKKRGKGRARRLSKRLHEAMERADIDSDPLQDDLLLRKIATRKQALDLASIPQPPRWHAPASYTADRAAQSRPPASSSKRTKAKGTQRASDAGSEVAHRAARPQSARPEPDDRTGPRPEPSEPFTVPEQIAGDGTVIEPGNAADMRSKRPGRKPDASLDVLIGYARRIHQETGRLSRDLLEETVRADSYSVASDRAGQAVRTVKTELKTARASHPH
ncbi:hypothetical protein OG285_16050 [Streptomyces sp. NBC_01471]|uniref:hypothetical protein n=1 Tax=Streptomyces sp. NBC_01471 TaxID=2903879 RepID=UPI003246BED6